MALAFEGTLPEPGDMRPVELFGRPLALVRGDDRVLRVFHNTCPYDGCSAAVRPAPRSSSPPDGLLGPPASAKVTSTVPSTT